MRVEQKVPLLLVERQALNDAMEGERHVSRSSQTLHDLLPFLYYFIGYFMCTPVNFHIINTHKERHIMNNPGNEVQKQ